MNIDITVAIPTYNGETRLSAVIKKLRSQIGVEDLNWEILIVDNNSRDNTASLIHNYQAEWNHGFPLRYLLETQQGAAFARIAAVHEAKGEFIAFLDDDNLPAPDWLKEAYIFGKDHPQAGAWSGQIHGAYEVKPPENFERIQAFLAIREHGEKPFLFEPDSLKLPPGACMIVRKQAWSENVKSQPVLTGRLSNLLGSSEDYEALLHIHKGGWKIWYNPTMHTYHQIPHWRFEKQYLLTLARSCGLSICQLRLTNAKNREKPIVLFRTVFGNLRRIMQHLIKYRSDLQSDIIALFEIEFYYGSMISPFYSFKKILTDVYQKILLKSSLKNL